MLQYNNLTSSQNEIINNLKTKTIKTGDKTTTTKKLCLENTPKFTMVKGIKISL